MLPCRGALATTSDRDQEEESKGGLTVPGQPLGTLALGPQGGRTFSKALSLEPWLRGWHADELYL